MHIKTDTISEKQSRYAKVKRALDIVIGMLGCMILIPMTIVIKFLYLLTGDHDRIIYRQKRIGLYGVKFTMWKYRSMLPNAERMFESIMKDNLLRQEWEAYQKLENDPRVTKIGRILRKTSIDELPQMLNVLQGTMSLIGPRPLIEGELSTHGGDEKYYQAKPGITGWWACNGRSDLDYSERLKLEYYYVDHLSFRLDLECFFRTIISVLKKTGAR